MTRRRYYTKAMKRGVDMDIVQQVVKNGRYSNDDLEGILMFTVMFANKIKEIDSNAQEWETFNSFVTSLADEGAIDENMAKVIDYTADVIVGALLMVTKLKELTYISKGAMSQKELG